MMGDGAANETDWNNLSQKIGSVCGETLQANGRYILTTDISSTGTCFTIPGNNITIDCYNYRITGPDTTALTYAVYSSAVRDGFTLKNCWIQDFRHGVYRYFSNSLFLNNTFNSTYENSIHLSFAKC